MLPFRRAAGRGCRAAVGGRWRLSPASSLRRSPGLLQSSRARARPVRILLGGKGRIISACRGKIRTEMKAALDTTRDQLRLLSSIELDEVVEVVAEIVEKLVEPQA